MKNYFYWLAIMIVSVVALPACSEDDNDAPDIPPIEEDGTTPEEDGKTPEEDKGDDVIVVNEKKLVKVELKSDASWSGTYTFSYDSKGRLIAATEADEYEGDYGDYEDYEKYITYGFDWDDDVITVTEIKSESVSGPDNYTITLNNGLVQYISEDDDPDDTYTFSYNSSNRIKKVVWFDGDFRIDEVAIWDGDKLLSVADNYDDAVTFTYGESCENGYCPLITGAISGLGDLGILFIAHPELIGMRTTQCPTSEANLEETETYEYEFDTNGYISKVLVTETYQNQTEKTTITFRWQ